MQERDSQVEESHMRLRLGHMPSVIATDVLTAVLLIWFPRMLGDLRLVTVRGWETRAQLGLAPTP